MKKTIEAIQQSKEPQSAPLVCLTAYTTPMASMAAPHCDLLLVGDSLAMVLHGMESTQGATMDMMIMHGQSVMRANPQSVVIVDMPYGSYEDSPVQALENAQRIMDETECDGVKLEGGEAFSETIKYLTDNDIPIFAHVGLLPQSASKPSDYKVQGRDEDSAIQIMRDAQAVEAAGAFAVVIEAVPAPLADAITQKINIPTIGIGAGNTCDGQILVTEDMIGMHQGHVPKFVKQYAELSSVIEQAIADYASEVKNRSFPEEKHTYATSKAKPAQENLKKAS